MRIAFIVGFFPSLSETFILNQITDLILYGNDIEIFAMENPGEHKVHPDVKKYHLLKRVSYFPVIPKNIICRILKGFFLFCYHFFKEPLKLLKCVNVFRFGKDALSLKLLYYSIPFLKKQFDIMHCHFGHNGIIGTYLKKVGFGTKLITTFHGYDLSAFIKLCGNDIYRNLFVYCDLCLPISHFWKEKLIQLGCKKEKIEVHRMGIAYSVYPAKTSSPPAPPIITLIPF